MVNEDINNVTTASALTGLQSDWGSQTLNIPVVLGVLKGKHGVL